MSLGDLPRIHPREKACRAAEAALREAIERAADEHELTDAELLGVVSRVCNAHVASFVRHAIRIERHGDPDRPGGVE